MDDLQSPFSWECLEYHVEDQGMEELKQALLYTTLELEKTIESAKEEITTKELEIFHLRNLLSVAMKERDEALCRCQLLLTEKPLRPSNPAEEETSTEDPLSSSSSSSSSSSLLSLSSLTEEALETVVADEKEKKKKQLPEKGKLLLAVMEAGPLLQTLLLAGPLPEWQHPPPKIDSSDIPIPPLAFSPPGSKRVLDLGHCGWFENSPAPKFPKVIFGQRR